MFPESSAGLHGIAVSSIHNVFSKIASKRTADGTCSSFKPTRTQSTLSCFISGGPSSTQKDVFPVAGNTSAEATVAEVAT